VNVFDTDREDVAGKLIAGGVANVTLDPRGQLPCVLVELPRVSGSEGVGGWQVELHVHIIANPPGDLDALGWLLDQLELVLVTFPGAETEPTTITRNDADCPAYVVRLTRSITSPNC
jgi:hypothetical protein